MEEASFAGTLRVIFYMVAFYYVFKFLARIFFPMLMKKAVEKAAESFEQQQRASNPFNSQTQRRHSQSDPVFDSKSDKPKERKKIGEYVDYEEIE